MMTMLFKLDSTAPKKFSSSFFGNALFVLGLLDFLCLWALPILGILNNFLLHISMHVTFLHTYLCTLLDSVYIVHLEIFLLRHSLRPIMDFRGSLLYRSLCLFGDLENLLSNSHRPSWDLENFIEKPSSSILGL